MAEKFPLISCVMPTYGRPDFVSEAAAMFLEQDYPAKELLVLNDCPGQVFHSDHPEIRVINANIRFPTLGEKRNASIELARGDYIAIWDDDDLYLPWRLSHSMTELQSSRWQFYRPSTVSFYWDSERLPEMKVTSAAPCHAAILFQKSLWNIAGGYPACDLGEDQPFLNKIHAHLGEEFIIYDIDPVDRFVILRFKSYYYHLSTGGGSNPLDSTPGDYPIIPKPIADPVLRRAYSRLSRLYKMAASSGAL